MNKLAVLYAAVKSLQKKYPSGGYLKLEHEILWPELHADFIPGRSLLYTKPPAPAATSPPLPPLPHHIVQNVLIMCHPFTMYTCEQVSHDWFKAVHSQPVWEVWGRKWYITDIGQPKTEAETHWAIYSRMFIAMGNMCGKGEFRDVKLSNRAKMALYKLQDKQAAQKLVQQQREAQQVVEQRRKTEEDQERFREQTHKAQAEQEQAQQRALQEQQAAQKPPKKSLFAKLFK
eukprot:Phypoly_transcript_17926.p1 GENE.Phypoly_transcript_17926~~Phypoly_transcript_17926.p1  ORF type:complete len:258 (+),score=52.02 Phypoly_transcript_17926:83-775(+)